MRTIIRCCVLIGLLTGASLIPAIAQNCIPDESPESVRYGAERDEGKPDDCTSVLTWAQAVQLNGQTAPSKIEVDYTRIYAHLNNGQDLLLDGDEYTADRLVPNEFGDRDGDGGLYIRSPWFDGDIHSSIPCEFNTVENTMIFHPSDYPDRVFHWWNSFKWRDKNIPDSPQHWRVTIPSGTAYCWAEVRVRITGPATVQVGLDYWTLPGELYKGANVSNREGSVSPWYCQNGEWLTVQIGKPSDSSTYVPVPVSASAIPSQAPVAVPDVALSSGSIQAPVFSKAFKGPDGLMKQGKAVAFVLDGKTYFSKELIAHNTYGDVRNPAVKDIGLMGGKKENWHLKKVRVKQVLREVGDYLVYDGVISEEHCQLGWDDPNDPAYDAKNHCVWSPAHEFQDRPGTFIKESQDAYGYLPVRFKVATAAN